MWRLLSDVLLRKSYVDTIHELEKAISFVQ